MHPVIKHIKERKNKSIPVNDGRKITLVLFGGIMSGISGAGAVVALAEMGLMNSFDRIYSYSAGFCNASYMLSGETKKGISIYYENLCGKSFFNPWRFWKIVDIDYLMHVMKYVKRLRYDSIFDQKTKLFVGLKNIRTKHIEFIDIATVPKIHYLKLIEASVSLPYLHPGSVTINGSQYEDVGNANINIEKVALSTNPSDVLVIYNLDEQKKDFQYPSEKVFEIMPQKEWQLNRFERDPDKLKASAQYVGRYVRTLFGSEGTISL